jgi:putative ABC transport system permease protein
MSLWSRMANVFRADRLSREIDEELQSHIEAAIEEGRDATEARRAFGVALRQREACRDVRLTACVDSLRADIVFGWRLMLKRKVTSAAAIFSLGLAIGACTSAFRLIGALLLWPLPVAHPEQLYALSRQGFSFSGKLQSFDGWAYPAFRLMRDAVKNEAELIAISCAERLDLSWQSDREMEKAYVQYVSGRMFPSSVCRQASGNCSPRPTI